MRVRLAGLVLLAPGLLVAGCGDEDTGEDGSGGTALPSCLASLTAVDVPPDADFPQDWAFPPGTVVTAVEDVPGGGTAVTAQVGSGFEEVLPFMQTDLEEAGFVATEGEAEDDDAEARWSGGGYAGTWAIRSSDSCAGTTLLQVAAAPAP